jgi:hypothetical protein
MNLLLKDDAEIFSKVLRISLGDSAAAPTSARGTPTEAALELEELASELKAEAGDATSEVEVAARWSDVGSRRSLFDRALVGRLSSTTSTPVVDFLVASFARAADLRARKGSSATPDLAEIIEYVGELCVSYSSIALLNPSMFPQPADAEKDGVLRLLGPLKADSLPAAFLARLVAKFAEEDSLAELGLPLFAKLAEEASKVTILSADYGPYRALLTLVRDKGLCALFATDASFLPMLCQNGALLQAGARLGPFFGVAAFPAELKISQQAFPDVGNPGNIEQSFSSIRSASQMMQRALLSISKEMLKNPDAKEPFFRFVAAACTLNGTRSQQWFPHAEGQRIMHAIAPENI